MIIILNVPFHYSQKSTKEITDQILQLNSFMFNGNEHQFKNSRSLINLNVKSKNIENFDEDLYKSKLLEIYNDISNSNLTIRNTLITAVPYNDLTEHPKIDNYVLKSTNYSDQVDEYISLVINKLNQFKYKIKVLICRTAGINFINRFVELVNDNVKIYNLCLSPENNFSLCHFHDEIVYYKNFKEYAEASHINEYFMKSFYRSLRSFKSNAELISYNTIQLENDPYFIVLDKKIKIPKFNREIELSNSQLVISRDLFSEYYIKLGYSLT